MMLPLGAIVASLSKGSIAASVSSAAAKAGPVVSSIMGTSQAAPAMATAGAPAAAKVASTAAQAVSGQAAQSAASVAMSRSNIGSIVNQVKSAFGGTAGGAADAVGAAAQPQAAAGGGGAGSIPPGAGSAPPPPPPGGGVPPTPPPNVGAQGQQLGAMSQFMGGLTDMYDALQVADQALGRFSGNLNLVRKPLGSMLNLFESGVRGAVERDPFMTDSHQAAMDAAWNATGMSFLESIPILGILPSIIKDVADTFIQLPRAMMGWAESLIESRMQIARYNATLAGVRVESERRQILRDVQSGAATSGSTQDLNEALQDLKDTVQPISDAMTNGFNFIATTLLRNLEVVIKAADIISDISNMFVPVKDAAVWFLGSPKGDTSIPWQEMMKDVTEKASNRYNPPPPGFGGGGNP